MDDFIYRLRKHQSDSLHNENFSPINAVIDCGTAADIIEKQAKQIESLLAEKAAREEGCDVCLHRRYFSNGGVFSRVSIHQDINGRYVLSCGYETVPVYICPKCGRKLRERNK
jgi:hypothetical protein